MKKVAKKKVAATKVAGKKPAGPNWKVGDYARYVLPKDEEDASSAPFTEGQAIRLVDKDDEDPKVYYAIPANADEESTEQQSVYVDELRLVEKGFDPEDEEEPEESEEEEETEDDDDTTEEEESEEDESEEEEVEDEEPDWKELGTLADGGDEDAGTALTEKAEELELDPNAYATWKALGIAIAKHAPAEEEEEAVEEEEAPKTGKRLIVKGKATASARKVAPSKKAAKKKVATPREPREPVVPEKVAVTKEVAAALKGKKSVEVAKVLVKRRQRDDHELGGVLTVIEQEKEHVGLKVGSVTLEDTKEGFELFVESVLEFSYRKAKTLMANYRRTTALGLSGEDTAELGYAKLNSLLDVMEAEPEKAKDWIERGKQDTQKQLDAKLTKARARLNIERKPRGAGAGSSGDTVKLAVHFFKDQNVVVQDAIEKAKANLDIPEGEKEGETLRKAVFEIMQFFVQNA